MCLYAVRRGPPEAQWPAWFAGTVEERRQPTGRLISTSLGQTLRQCTIAPANGGLRMQMQPHLIPTLILPFALCSSSDGDQGPYSPEISPHVDKVYTLKCSSADSNTSGPISFRVLWLVCLSAYVTHTSSHPGISPSIASKRCLLLRLRLCDQCCQVRGRTARGC